MGITEALHASADGKTIVSCAGVYYQPQFLNAKKLGSHGAVCDSVILTEIERKGRWRIDGQDETRSALR